MKSFLDCFLVLSAFNWALELQKLDKVDCSMGKLKRVMMIMIKRWKRGRIAQWLVCSNSEQEVWGLNPAGGFNYV